MYDDVVSEDIPDDFLNLLEQADERRTGATASADQPDSASKPKR